MKKSCCSSGFTLVELLIVIAIIGVLLAAGIPSYQQYVMSARFTEIKRVAAPFKLAMEAAVMLGKVNGSSDQDIINALNGGSFGIPDDIAAYDSEYVSSITTASGVITVTAKNFPEHIAAGSPTYKLTAKSINNLGHIIYDTSANDSARGTCYSVGLCD